MQAVILSIGDELVLGQTVDANSAWLSARLAEQGITTRYHQTLADEQHAIAQAITAAAEHAELVLITGGLGPTSDDLTRQALAEALQSRLVTDPKSLEQIEAFFAARGKTMPERNAVQAQRPEKARAVLNDAGTAPGIEAQLAGATIYAMPGVPREMRRMWQNSLAPAIARNYTDAPARVIRTRKLNTFGLGESDVAERLGNLMQRGGNPTVGTTVSDGIVSVRVRAEFATAEQADQALDQTCAQIEQYLGPILFGRDDDTLQTAVLALLHEQGLTVATAESCTGGLIGAMLTDVPGSSEHYLGGWVTYTNAMKTTELNVPEAMLAEHGAVSEPVVRALAGCALEQSGAHVAVAVSGIAGPGGGSEDKPVGTVWIALAQRNGPDAPTQTQAMHFQLPGDRAAVRDRAAKCALQMIRLHLLGEALTEISWGKMASNAPA
jgi:nicotinamide-nucleotide amidase